MTLQQLQYIVALDRHRHFVKASESCFVAQPTLTLQVKKLEEEISTVIFDRSTQPLKPTEIGEAFILKAKRILKEVEELKHMVNDDKDDISGEFHIGVIPTLGSSLLPLFLSDFAQAHPDTNLVIEELESEEIIERLEHKLLDIGLMVTPLEDDNFKEVPIFHEPFVVYANDAHGLLQKEKVKAKDLKPQEIWILKQGHCFRNQTLNICDFSKEAERMNGISMEGGSIETLKNLVKSVSGYTLIPELSYKVEHDKSNVVFFEEPQPAREVSIVVHKHFTKDKLINEIQNAIQKNIPEHFSRKKAYRTIKWR